MATEGQERCGEVPAAAATPPAMARWLGPPTRQEEGRTFYAAFEAGGQQFTLGDAVYLRPAQPGLAPFVAKLESLHQVEQDGSMLVGVKWFYRPTEIEVGHEVSVEQNEVFCSDDFATHPLSAVCGKCDVLTPAQVDRCLGSSTAEPAGADTFVCSRKYIQAEGRIVPMDDGMAWVSLTAALQEKPFAVVGGKVVQRGPTAEDKAAVQPRPKRVRPTSAADGAAAPVPGEQQQQQGQQRGKRRRRPRGTHSPEPHAPATTATAAAAQAPRDEGGSSDHLPSTSAMTDGSQHSGGTAGGSRRTATTSRSRAGKATTGRWIKDRYDAAQQSLVAVMRRLGATAADCAILRPTLREEARKAVGDTGLLDHLLKHMADQVVGPSGDRLRRRHNKDGHMVYWLQSPAEAEQEEQALREEMETLRSELAEVKEARRVLHAVRGETAQAIQARHQGAA